jgi:hypothetical protein
MRLPGDYDARVGPGRAQVEGRFSRADMAARGVPRTTVDGWYRDRARTGHPEKAGRIGATDYWYEDEVPQADHPVMRDGKSGGWPGG